jgi:hypothetical protein
MRIIPLGYKLVVSASCAGSWASAPINLHHMKGFAVQIVSAPSGTVYPYGTYSLQVTCDGGSQADGDPMGTPIGAEHCVNWATVTGSVVSGSAGPSPIIWNVNNYFGTYARLTFTDASGGVANGWTTVKAFGKGES